MATKWKAPKGFVLTKHDGYTINTKGFRAAEGDEPMPDGQIGVAWWSEDEPFIASEVHDRGEGGWSPNVQILPIDEGWVPPCYQLHTKEEAP